METVKKVIEKVLPTTTTAPTLTKQTGCPIAVGDRSLTAGPHGPIVFSDVQLIEKLTQFDREKTPPRNVHALGTGCYGTFTVTNDITKYSKASIFSQIGKKTDLVTRLSGIFLELGEADTMRDPRGFALKFYTDEGNWDLMGINTPVFNVRDAKLGPDAVHAFKRDPRTGMWNPTQVWDFVANHPESLHQTLMIYTDKGGTPASYRYMTAYGCHTFALINKENIRHWVKFHIISEQGTKGLTQKEAKLIAGEDPNFLARDLWQAIERGDYPKWKLCIQVMNDDEGYKNPIAFDPTKTWSHKDYPLIEVGVIELNRNPTDFHAEVEQVAFSSANVVPGIGLSPDRLLQGRLLIYDDTQHHRLGANFKQLPVNRPRIETNTMLVGGPMNFEVKNKFPHYLGNSFGGPKPDPKHVDPPLRADGPVDFYAYPGEGTDEDYYAQPGDFVRLLIPKDRLSLIENLATSLEKVLSEEVVRKMLHHLHKIDIQFGNEVETLLRQRKEGVVKKTEAEKVVETMTKLLNTHTATSE